MIAFSGINAPNTIPNDIGLIGPLGMSGMSNFEIVLGVLFDTPILSDNSSTTVVISSDIEANSKNLVESCVKTPGLFGYAKKATGRLAPIIIMVSKSLRTSTALSTTYGILTEFILPAPLSKRALNQSVLIGQPILSATFANLMRLFSSKASPPTSIRGFFAS